MSILTRNKVCKYLFFLALSLLIGCVNSAPKQYPTPQIPASKFHSADLAMRLGRTIESDLIARSGEGNDRYSHIGIIIESDSGLVVIDIEPSTDKHMEQIKAQSLKEFFSPSKAIAGAVFRYKELDSIEINTLKTCAIRELNSSITFDHDYLLSDPTQMYCTELIEHIYKSINVSLSEGRTQRLPLAKEPVIMPSDISRNKNLEKIWSYDLRALRDSIR